MQSGSLALHQYRRAERLAVQHPVAPSALIQNPNLAIAYRGASVEMRASQGAIDDAVRSIGIGVGVGLGVGIAARLVIAAFDARDR